MSWNLTIPVNNGDLGPDSGEVDVSSVHFYLREKFMRILLEYGNTVGDDFESGPGIPQGKSGEIIIEGPEYEAFVAAHQALYESVRQAIYAELRSRNDIDDGAVS